MKQRLKRKPKRIITMPSNNITLNEIAEYFKKEDNFLFLCHKSPDADTLGSALALKTALTDMGKRAKILCTDSPSANTAFLFENGECILDTDYNGENIVSVDVASLSLLGALKEIYGERIVLKLDHHMTSDDFAKYNYTDYSSAACGEIVYEIIKLLGTPMSDVAKYLYAAVSSDTGGFRYSNTTSKTHLIAAELLLSGADNAYIDHMLFENRTQAEIRAINAAYSSLRYYHDGKVSAVIITNDVKSRLNLSDDDLGSISSLTREIEGVTVGIMLRQLKNEPSKYKMSVRSEPGFPANELCLIFGGGGHPCAAGAEVEATSPERALSSVIKHISYENGKLGVK